MTLGGAGRSADVDLLGRSGCWGFHGLCAGQFLLSDLISGASCFKRPWSPSLRKDGSPGPPPYLRSTQGLSVSVFLTHFASTFVSFSGGLCYMDLAPLSLLE